jgi:glycosyltransferase involved in cell wall biosynthesis
MTDAGIVMILSGFPRRSETFALNEVLALERRHALAGIFATKAGELDGLQPAARQLSGRVQRLPEGSPEEQAEFVVQRLNGRKVSGVHGYFAHTPAEVAVHVAAKLNRPYGFSTHAKDARKVAPDVLARRASGAACVVACNPDVAHELRNAGANVHLIPHGVDTAHFRPTPFPAAQPLRMLAVGRLVEKKGFHVLIAAAARLRFPFALRIVGTGPEESRQAEMIAALGLSNRVTLCGPRTHEELPGEYSNAHVLVAPSITDCSGDRDGLPNVILEAMACGRAVVGTDAGAIATVLKDRENGLLVPQGNVESLASALELLAVNPGLLRAFGERGRQLVEREYEVGRCAGIFCRALQEAYA